MWLDENLKTHTIIKIAIRGITQTTDVQLQFTLIKFHINIEYL